MVTIEQLRDYLGLLPDSGEAIATLCLAAAKTKARGAGIPNYQSNAQYDVFICALAGCWYDNRNFGFIGSGNRGTANAETNARAMINSHVLELRYATEDDGTQPPPWPSGEGVP